MPVPSRGQLDSIRGHNKRRLHGTGISPTAETSGTQPTTPKKVPTTPKNTPAATSSPSTIVSDSKKKSKKTRMGKKSTRTSAEKRHLVRWNATLDAKLLLTMQYQCNLVGIVVPYDDIGRTMGEGITGGAVIQHLAKLRSRMVAAGLPVPPPLRRGGGGSRIPATASVGSKAKATATKKGNAQANPTLAKSKKAGKRAAPCSDDSDEEEDSWINDDSDMDYGESRTKRTKYDAKGSKLRPKTETEDSGEEVATPSSGSKRKPQSSKSSNREISAYGATDVNVGSDVEDGTEAGLIAADAPWLTLENDYASHRKTGGKTPYKNKSLVVSLATTRHNTNAMGAVKEEDFGDMSDEESEEDMVGGGVEDCVDESHLMSNEELDNIFSAPMNDHDFKDFIAPQLGQMSGSSKHNGMYNNSYHAGPELMTFNGDPRQNRQAFAYAPSTFQANGGMFENDGFAANQAKEQFGGFESENGGNFGYGPTSTNFNHQTTSGFGDNDDGFDFNNNGVVDVGAFENGGMFNGIAQQDAFAYQAGDGYGASTNVFGDNIGGNPLNNGHNHSQLVPYQIQTSWPGNHGSLGASTNTSLNQTPVGTSAGADVGTGYFSNGHFDPNAYINYSGEDGTNEAFTAGQVDGNAIGDGLYQCNPYGF